MQPQPQSTGALRNHLPRVRRQLAEPRRPRRAELPQPDEAYERQAELRCAACAKRHPGRRSPVLGLMVGPERGRRWHVIRADYNHAWHGGSINDRSITAYWEDNGVRWVSECADSERDRTGRMWCPACGHRPGVGHARLIEMADAAVQAAGTPVLLI